MELPSWNFSMMHYGSEWKKHRRVFHQFLNHTAVAQFHPILHEERDNFLQKFGDSPQDFLRHIEM